MNKIAKFFRDYAFARFALPAGLILIIFGIIVFGIVNSRKDNPRINATVTKLELAEEAHMEGGENVAATYHIFVKYTVDGKEYEGEYMVGPEKKVGSTVKIEYNPNDPTDIGQPNSILLPLALIAVGAVLLAAAIVSIMRTAEKNKALKRQEEEWNHGN